GVDNRVVDSAAIEVNRRRKRAKTDPIDAAKLLHHLIRYYHGETKVWGVVRLFGPEVGGRHGAVESFQGPEGMPEHGRLAATWIVAGVGVEQEARDEFADGQVGGTREHIKRINPPESSAGFFAALKRRRQEGAADHSARGKNADGESARRVRTSYEGTRHPVP